MTGTLDASRLHSVAHLAPESTFAFASEQPVLFLFICQSCHFCLLAPFPGISSPVPDFRCISPLSPPLHPKINNLCSEACQLFAQKSAQGLGCSSGLYWEESFQNLCFLILIFFLLQILLQLLHNFSSKHTETLSNLFLGLFLIALFRLTLRGSCERCVLGPESSPCQISLSYTQTHSRGETLRIWPLLIAGFVWKGFLDVMTRRRLERKGRGDYCCTLLYIFPCVVSRTLVPAEALRSRSRPSIMGRDGSALSGPKRPSVDVPVPEDSVGQREGGRMSTDVSTHYRHRCRLVTASITI